MKKKLFIYLALAVMTLGLAANGYAQWNDRSKLTKFSGETQNSQKNVQTPPAAPENRSRPGFLETVIEVTNVGENWKGWREAKIKVLLKGNGEAPKNGSFNTDPEGALSSANPKDYYRWSWEADSKTLRLIEKWPGQPGVVLVILSGVSLPFTAGDSGRGTLVALSKTRTDQPLTWEFK